MEEVFSWVLSRILFLLPEIFVHGFTDKLVKIVDVLNQ